MIAVNTIPLKVEFGYAEARIYISLINHHGGCGLDPDVKFSSNFVWIALVIFTITTLYLQQYCCVFFVSAKLIRLPTLFLHESGRGGGVIQVQPLQL